MKNILLAFLIFFTSFQVGFAQEWGYDLEEAKLQAKENDKTVILVFQGSDWCRPCVMLKEEIFETTTFELYAKDHFVLVEADFPRRPENALSAAQQEKNRALGLTYNPRGIFPFVVIMNKEGEVLGETGYFSATASEYILHLESFQ